MKQKHVIEPDISFDISFFDDCFDVSPRLVHMTWTELCTRIANPIIRVTKAGLLLSPAVFVPPERKAANVIALSILFLDYDHDALLTEDVKVWTTLGLQLAVYTTHSHRRVTAANPNAEDRFRVLIPLKEPIPASMFSSLWKWAACVSGGKIDRAAKDVSRMFYMPAKAYPDACYEYYIHSGSLLDWRALRLACSTDEQTAKAIRQQEGFEQGTTFDIRDYTNRLEGFKVTQRGWGYAKCPAHQGKGRSSLFIALDSGAYGCFAGCSCEAIRRSIGVPKITRAIIDVRSRAPFKLASIGRPTHTVKLAPPIRPACTERLALLQRPTVTIKLEKPEST